MFLSTVFVNPSAIFSFVGTRADRIVPSSSLSLQYKYHRTRMFAQGELFLCAGSVLQLLEISSDETLAPMHL